jgi:hypothetical protein
VERAEAVQRPRFAGAVAELPEQCQCLVEVLHGQFVLAQLTLTRAEAVQRVRFAGEVAGLAVQGQGLPVVAGGGGEPALPRLIDAEVGQGAGFVDLVASLPGQRQNLLVVAGGRLVMTQPLLDRADGVEGVEGVEGVGLAGPIVGPPEQAQGLPEVFAGRSELTQLQVGGAELLSAAASPTGLLMTRAALQAWPWTVRASPSIPPSR